MYCRKCGKWIDYDAPFCRECEATERAPQVTYTPPVYTYTYQNEPVQGTGRMYGFGKALSSTILSFVAYIFAIITYILGVSSAIVADGDGTVATVVMFVLGFIPGMIALGQGILSIRCFRSRGPADAKPIATLILGITGVSLAAFSLFFEGIVMLLLVATLGI